MPLHQLNNSAVLRNKENARQIDPQQSLNSSPVKNHSISNFKSSPQKKNITAEINQLKIKLSDRDFQLKRLEEDCSVKLALMQKELTKEKNQKNRILKESKQKLEEDRTYFETKIATLEHQWKAKLQKMKNQAVNETKALQHQQKNSLKVFYEQSIRELKAQISVKQESFLKEKQVLTQLHEKHLISIEAKHKSELQEVNSKNEAEMNHLRVAHLSELQFYHQMEEQKTKQQNVVSKILSDKIRSLEEETRLLRGQISELNKEIQLKNQEIHNQKREKQDFRLDKICLERKIGRMEPQLKENCQNQIRKAKEEYERLLNENVSSFTQRISELKSLYEQSMSSYQTQITQLEERCKQVAALHSSLKSNEEDVKKIEMLELKLIKREMELEKEREDTKMCRLELGNMDQMFQKMFEEAKVKSLKARKHKLPSLLSVGQHKTTMDCYNGMGVGPVKENKKFSIREVNYNSICKGKESDFSLYE